MSEPTAMSPAEHEEAMNAVYDFDKELSDRLEEHEAALSRAHAALVDEVETLRTFGEDALGLAAKRESERDAARQENERLRLGVAEAITILHGSVDPEVRCEVAFEVLGALLTEAPTGETGETGDGDGR